MDTIEQINGLEDSLSALENNKEQAPHTELDSLSLGSETTSPRSQKNNAPLKKYAYRHKPTNTWVYFLPNRGNNPVVTLCLKPDASFFEDEALLKEKLLKSSFNGEKDYCKYNFLEFEMVTVNFFY